MIVFFMLLEVGLPVVLVALLLNVSACCILAREFQRTGRKDTSPGFAVFWSAVFSACANLSFLLVILLVSWRPIPGWYFTVVTTMVSAVTLGFWYVTKLCSMAFNYLMVMKFLAWTSTIRLSHRSVLVCVVVMASCLAFLTLCSRLWSDNVLRGVFANDLISTPFLAADMCLYLLSFVVMAIVAGVARIRSSLLGAEASDSERDAVRRRSREVTRAFRTHLAYPVIFVFLPVLPAGFYEVPSRDWDPYTGPLPWTLLGFLLHGGQGCVIFLCLLCERRSSLTGMESARSSDREDSLRLALEEYLKLEGRRIPDWSKAERDLCEQERHFQPLAHFDIVYPWKFRCLRSQWGVELPTGPLPSNTGLCTGNPVPLGGMEVVFEAEGSVVDYLNSIVPFKILADRRELQGYFNVNKDDDECMLCRIYGALKIRLDDGSCFSVIFSERLGDGRSVRLRCEEELERFKGVVSSWWPERWRSLIDSVGLSASLKFLVEHEASGYSLMVADPDSITGQRRACIVNYWQPSRAPSRPGPYKQAFSELLQEFEERQLDTRATCPCYLPKTAFKTVAGLYLPVGELRRGDEVRLPRGGTVRVQSVQRIAPQLRKDLVELSVRYQDGHFCVTGEHRIEVVANPDVKAGTDVADISDEDLSQCEARQLRNGDKVIYGERVQTVNVKMYPQINAKRTEVYQVIFEADAPVETLWVPLFGFITRGDRPETGVPTAPHGFTASQTSQPSQPSQSSQASQLFEQLCKHSEATVQEAMDRARDEMQQEFAE